MNRASDSFGDIGQSAGRPVKQGLYDPQFEKDACGVGFVCSLKGEKSHSIITKGLEILVNLTHRGACGCDPDTGDGAGILIQVPHEFMKKKAEEISIKLPAPGAYAVGMVFLPQDMRQREYCINLFEQVVKQERQVVLGWRRVPTNNESIGITAKKGEPIMKQIFIGRGHDIKDNAHFERKLYIIRKIMERSIRESYLPQKASFYIPSLSSRTLIYKGMLLATQIESYYPDLMDEEIVSGLALVHQRYSTNTFPTWDLAQPFRFLCHNGEINTLRGNYNWMSAREGVFKSELFGDEISKLFPSLTPGASDSANLDNAVELLYHTGRSLPHAIMMLIPEAWQNHESMSEEKRAFYEYHACLMEPWDGPASIAFTDGHFIGAVLDRNGLRPSRYTVTKDGFVIMGSETGVLDIEPANVLYKGRLQPGRMFLVDMDQKRIVDDEEIKSEMYKRRPYVQWLKGNLLEIDSLPDPEPDDRIEKLSSLRKQKMFGYSLEDLNIILGPMAEKGVEPLGSMGADTPLAVLSSKTQLLYDYFKQLFAQVTNPPLDAIREELVTSLITYIGYEQDLFQETPIHANLFKLHHPILTDKQLAKVHDINRGNLRSITLPMVYKAADGPKGLKKGLDDMFKAAADAIDDGYSILILSDKMADRENAPIPALLATSGLHHHLIRIRKRTRCGIIIQSGEPREIHHFCLLMGYGASAVNPYLAYETLAEMVEDGSLPGLDLETAVKNYIKAVCKGILKVMSKMGISTLQSYQNAQIFEAVGLNEVFIEEFFKWTPSRLGGIGLKELTQETANRHFSAFPEVEVPENLDLDVGGKYQWRRKGEHHLFGPLSIAKLQESVRKDDPQSYQEYSDIINEQNRQYSTLRGMLEFRTLNDPIPLDEVEPWTEIVKRFKTGAMSYGSISQEAHENLAIAMNRIGGKSNSGEGGESPDRYHPDKNGDWRRSAIKQVASGRFGVTSNYLVNAAEIQIKMAQGAKPGEGGQLPGQKVFPWVAKVRYSTPYVQLISPPPHHDIYSIEDLSQLIHDLKNANPQARINVKLVAEVGVGAVAAGVSKGKADVVLISGYDGGTGASPLTSIRHTGLPWELGLAETHQTLVLNDLRSRIIVEVDGQLKTGRDVAVGALLGAEEYGFATVPLVASGCIMMRKCHLNTCPVGVATQDPELRKKFQGKPEHVINYFHFVAEELRQIMASLGFRTINEMIGRSDKLKLREDIQHWKASTIDFSRILHKPEVPAHIGTYCTQKQDHGLDQALDHDLIEKAKPALENKEPVVIDLAIRNINRTVGTMLSSEISRRYDEEGLPDDTITINCTGSAGQSFAAFGAPGLTMKVEGDANDYFCKGLSGAKVIIYPPKEATFIPHETIIIGNVALYGATRGEMYIRGRAGERFCVRNSGALAVVEGIGDHGCEYMTGGRAVIIGTTGRNFAAGMSGGVAYVLDETGNFAKKQVNTEMVELEHMADVEEILQLRKYIEDHYKYTESRKARQILDDWDQFIPLFIKVIPVDYKHALKRLEEEQAAASEQSGRAVNA